jgi:hypothetical protein
MELAIFAILLFIVIVVWGLSSVSQSLATAKQAQVTIETARAAQVASTGNLVTILLGFGLWMFYRLRIKPTLRRAVLSSCVRPIFRQQHNQPGLTGQDLLGQLTQLVNDSLHKCGGLWKPQAKLTSLSHQSKD